MKHKKASFVTAMTAVAKLYSSFKWVLIGSFFLIMCAEATSLLTPFFVSRMISGGLWGLDGFQVALLVLLVEVLSNLFLYLHWLNDQKNMEFQARDSIIKNTLQKLFGFSVGQVTHEHSGYLQSVISKGETAIVTIVKTFFQEILPTTAKIIVTTVALFYYAPKVAWWGVGATLTFIGISMWLNIRIRSRTKKQQYMENQNQQWYSDVVRNLKLILLNAQQERILKDQNRRYLDTSTFSRAIWIGYNSTVCFIREPVNKIFFMLMLVNGLALYQSGGIKLWELIMLSSWITILFRHFDKIGIIQRKCINEYPSIYMYFDVLSEPPQVVVPKNPTRPKKIKGKIELRNVSFSYQTGNEENPQATVKNISQVFEPGKTYALVGRSGAGKSTLISLIQRWFDPDEGEILVDGVDLRLIDLNYYRRNIGYVEQEIKLWDATIRENIVFGLNGESSLITEAELDAVAEKACITEFFDRLGPKKFETLIGENGIQLSGGQRQRVGIARALIKNPPIFIFDEATNSLDTISDSLIQKAIRVALQGRTGIIIAHRLSTVRHADQIIVMDAGRIVGVGKHDELLRNCPEYIHLVEKDETVLA